MSYIMSIMTQWGRFQKSPQLRAVSFLTLFATVLLTASAFSSSTQASPLTLDQALSEGLQNSPKLQKAKATADEISWKKTEALQGFLPSVNLSASHLLGKQYMFVDANLGAGPFSIAQVIPSNQWTLSASLPLFEGFSSTRKYQGADLLAQAATLEYEWSRFSLEKEISLKFYQALAAYKLKDVAEQNVKTLEEHMKQVETLKKGGVATNYDVLRVEVQLNEARSEILKTEDDVVLAKQRLLQCLGEDQDSREISGELPTPSNLNVQNLNLSSRQRKDILALSQKVEATFKKEQAESVYWSPKLSLVGAWTSYNNRTDALEDQDQYRWSYNVGLYLTWNLFDGMGSIARSQQAVYQRLQSEKSLKQTELQSQYDFNFWKRRLDYSRSLYKAKLVDIEKAQESVRLAREGNKAGTRTSTEVLDAELDLFRARAGVVQSQINSIEAMINLELALGQELKQQ